MPSHQNAPKFRKTLHEICPHYLLDCKRKNLPKGRFALSLGYFSGKNRLEKAEKYSYQKVFFERGNQKEKDEITSFYGKVA